MQIQFHGARSCVLVRVRHWISVDEISQLNTIQLFRYVLRSNHFIDARTKSTYNEQTNFHVNNMKRSNDQEKKNTENRLPYLSYIEAANFFSVKVLIMWQYWFVWIFFPTGWNNIWICVRTVHVYRGILFEFFRIRHILTSFEITKLRNYPQRYHQGSWLFVDCLFL